MVIVEETAVANRPAKGAEDALTAARPDAFTPDLAGALGVLGRAEDALAFAHEVKTSGGQV